MAFWWPLIVLGVAFAICRFLLMLIPPNVPSIEVDASDVLEDGSQTKENGYIYIPRKGKMAQADKVRCYEPATMKYLGCFPALTPDEVRDHVAQAREAQKIWANSSFRQRRQFLRILLKYIIEHQELICEVSSRDTGKTMVDASLGEIMTTCEKITWLLAEGEKWLKPEYRSSGRSMLHKRAKVEFHPLGVIGAIVSWNYPFHNVFNPMLAAVFSGNAVVIKVSEHATWSGCFYLRIIQAALAAVGAPENLVHIITGFAETGQALVSSVDKIIFVGSPGVGKMIMQKASETLIPVTLELGGKDAFIVCEDVDLPAVVQVAMRGTLQSSGQNCAGAERFYVHKDIYPAFVAQIVKLVKSISVGPPLSGRYDMGAICMQEHSEKLQNLVNDALDKGAEIVGRGSFGHLGEGAVDHFFPPTVIVKVDHTMKLMQEEAFGPIIPIMKFSSDEEVVKLANDSNYGLGCAVFSGNQKRAIAIASQLHCGVAAINDFASTYMCQVHWLEVLYGPLSWHAVHGEDLEEHVTYQWLGSVSNIQGILVNEMKYTSSARVGIKMEEPMEKSQSLPFGGVKHSGFGRFAGVEGLRACCLVKSVVEDRWWPFIKTVIPKPIQYPVAENALEFQESLVEALYGLNAWDRLRSLIHVVKIISEQNPKSVNVEKRR